MPKWMTDEEETVLDQLVALAEGDIHLLHKVVNDIRYETKETPQLSEVVRRLMLIIAQRPVGEVKNA
jgi:hypothetical protein